MDMDKYIIKMYLAIAKKQKSAVNVLLFAPTFVKKFAPEFANSPAKEWVNLYLTLFINFTAD